MVRGRRFDGYGVRLFWLLLTLSLVALLGASTLVRNGAGAGRAESTIEALLMRAFDATAQLSSSVADAVPPEAPIELNDGRSAVSPRWRAQFENFVRADRAGPVAPGGVVFVGSSSISGWPALAQEFPGRRVIGRGLGGAQMADCAQHADRLVLPYRPRTVVVYAGDNDLAEGVSPEGVLAASIELIRQVHRTLPAARIVFVSIKPSPAREALLPQVRRTNALIAAHVRSDRRLDYIDVFTPMLDAAGRPRPELFQPDALHPSAAGYALWSRAISTHLD